MSAYSSTQAAATSRQLQPDYDAVWEGITKGFTDDVVGYWLNYMAPAS